MYLLLSGKQLRLCWAAALDIIFPTKCWALYSHYIYLVQCKLHLEDEKGTYESES